MTELGYTEKTDLTLLCKTLLRPGGQVERRAVDGTVTMVNDPGGIAISNAAERRLSMVSYIIVRQRAYMGRPTRPPLITRDYIYFWEDRQKAKDSLTGEITTDPAITDFHKDWTRAFETMDMYFSQRLSEITKVPLSYLYRKERVVKSDLADPSTNYTSWAKEQVARCPHFEMPGVTTHWYDADNSKLWYILHSMFKGSTSYTHMKAFGA